MSTNVENQVVELEFDNRDFEKNVSTSLKTLETLKEKLKFENASKGFEQIQNGLKNIDFSTLENKLSSLESTFDTILGRIEFKINDFIASATIGKFQELFNMTIGQVKSGGRTRAQNIEQAQFKIKGLGKDWNKVYEDMDYAVSGTAYGIDQAANAAAQFLASNVHTGDDMKAALRGISGVAAMTSSGYDEIARVFTAAAGKGRVMALELNRISLRGVNAAAALAEYLNTTEAQVRKLASKGEISFQTFANAMDAAFGEHAKKANETFAGSLANVRAALSRIGEIYYEPWIRSMIPFFNALRTSIDYVKNALKGVVEYTLDEDGALYKITTDNNVAVNLRNFLLELGKLKTEMVKSFIPSLETIGQRFDWLNEKLQTGAIYLKALTAQFIKYNKQHTTVGKTVEEQAEEAVVSTTSDPKFLGITTTIANTAITLDNEIGSTVTSIIDRYKALYNAQKTVLQSTTSLFSKWTHQYKTSFKTLNKNLNSNKKGLEKLQKDMATLEKKGIMSKDFIERLKSMGTQGADIIHALSKATDKDLKEYMKTWNQTEGMFDTISEEWTKGAKKEAEENLEKLTGIPEAKMEDYIKSFDDMFKQVGISAGENYTAGFQSVYAQFEQEFAAQLDAIDEYNQKLAEAEEKRQKEADKKAAENQKYEVIYEHVENMVQKMQKAMADTGFVVPVIEQMHQALSDLFATLQQVGHIVFDILSTIGKSYVETWEQFNVVNGEVVEGPLAKLLRLIRILVENFDIAGERGELIKSTFKGLFSIFELLKWVISSVIDAIAPLLINISQGEPIILRVTAAIGEFITSVVDAIINGGSITEGLGSIIDGIKGFFTGFINLLKGDGKNSEGLFSNLFNGISNIVSNITTIITNIFKKSKKGPSGSGGGFGEVTKTIFDEIFNVERLADVFGDAFYYIQKAFDSVFNISDTFLTIIPDIFKTVWGFIKENGESISELMGSIIKLATKLVNTIDKLLDKFTDNNDGKPGKGAQALNAFFDMLVTIFETVRDIIAEIKDPITAIAKGLTEIINKFVQLFSNFAQWAGEDPERSYGAAAFFMIMNFLILWQKNKLMGTDGIFGSIKNFFKSMTETFNIIHGTIKGMSLRETSMDSLRKLAVSVLMFAAAIWLIAKALTNENGTLNIGGIIAIITVFGLIITLTKVITAWQKALPASATQILKIDELLYVVKKITLSFAILAIAMGLMVKMIGNAEHPIIGAVAAFGLMLTMLGIFMVIWRSIVVLSRENVITCQNAAKLMASVGAMLIMFAVSVAIVIAAIIPLIAVVSVFRKWFGEDNKGFDAVMGYIAGGLILIFGAMILMVSQTKNLENIDYKSVGMAAVMMLAMAVSISMIIGALAVMIAAMGILKGTQSMELAGLAIGGLVIIMGLMLGFLKLGSKIKGDSFLQMAAAMVGMALFMLALSKIMLIIGGLAVAFKLAGVTSTDVENVMEILSPLVFMFALLAAVFAGIAIAFKSTGTAGLAGAGSALAVILGIAAAIYIIASAFSKLTIAVAIFLGVGALIGTFWEKIKPGFTKMLEDLGQEDGLLHQLISVIGLGIRWLCDEIILSAPKIAQALATVHSAIIFVAMQKAPARALAWLMVIDEILNIFIKGSGSIINKLFLMLEIVIDALDANAYILGKAIGSIVFKALWGAITGAWEAFLDWLRNHIEYFYDELSGTFIDSASKWKINEKIGDIFYKLFTGEKFEDDETDKIYKRDVGWVDYATEQANALKEGATNAEYKVEEAMKVVTEKEKKIDEALNQNGQSKYNWQFDSSKYDVKVTSIKDDEAFKELAKEHNVDIDQAAAITTNGENSASLFGDAFSGVLNSEDGNPILGWLSNVFGDAKTKDAAEGAGKSVGETILTGAMSIINNATGDSGWFSDTIGSSLTAITGKFDMNNQPGLFTNYNDLMKSGDFQWMTNGITGMGDQNMDPNAMYGFVAPTDGSSTGMENYVGADGTFSLASLFGATNDNIAVTNETTARSNETMDRMDKTINELQKKIDNVIMVSREAKLQTIVELDSKQVGKSVYPVVGVLSDNERIRSEASLSTRVVRNPN